ARFGSRGVGDDETGSEGAGTGVVFRLGQVERILALDRAGTHVVADGVAENFALAVYREGELGFGHVPGRVAADPDVIEMPPRPRGGGLENQLGAGGFVDLVVEDVTARSFGFLHPRGAAAEVGHSGGPDL